MQNASLFIVMIVMAKNIEPENQALNGPRHPRETNGVSDPAKPAHEEELVQTISVKPPKPQTPNSAGEVLKRTAILAAISAGVAALIKKTIYPFMVEHQPDIPIRIPDEVGFFGGGVAGASALLLLRKKIGNKPMSRRDFFPVIGSGIGALIGGMVAKPGLPKPQAEPTHSREDCTDGGKIDT